MSPHEPGHASDDELAGVFFSEGQSKFLKAWRAIVLRPMQTRMQMPGVGPSEKHAIRQFVDSLIAEEGEIEDEYNLWAAGLDAKAITSTDQVKLTYWIKKKWGEMSNKMSEAIPLSTLLVMGEFKDSIDFALDIVSGQARAVDARNQQLKETYDNYVSTFENAAINPSLDKDAQEQAALMARALNNARQNLEAQYEDLNGPGADPAQIMSPSQFLDALLPSIISDATFGTPMQASVVPDSAGASLGSIFAGIQAGVGERSAAAAEKKRLGDERKAQQGNLAAQQKQQIATDLGQAQTIQAIRAEFPDRPDLALKAEVAHRNNLAADPNADPNLAVQQFAGQAEGEKRIAQGLFDAGLDTASLSPEARKAVMEKGFTAETLPDLVASLPAFKTQFPTAEQFGAKEIADSIIKKAMAEQPGNPILSIQSQLQPSPSNPNAPVTPAWADAISKQAEQMGVSPTALAKAATGNPEAVLREQNIRQNTSANVYRSLGKKFGITDQQINAQVLRNQFGADYDTGKYRMYLSELDDGSVADVDSHYVGTLFQSGQADARSIVGGLVKSAGKQLPADLDKMSTSALQQYVDTLPDPPTPAELAARQAQQRSKLKVTKV